MVDLCKKKVGLTVVQVPNVLPLLPVIYDIQNIVTRPTLEKYTQGISKCLCSVFSCEVPINPFIAVLLLPPQNSQLASSCSRRQRFCPQVRWVSCFSLPLSPPAQPVPGSSHQPHVMMLSPRWLGQPQNLWPVSCAGLALQEAAINSSSLPGFLKNITGVFQSSHGTEMGQRQFSLPLRVPVLSLLFVFVLHTGIWSSFFSATSRFGQGCSQSSASIFFFLCELQCTSQVLFQIRNSSFREMISQKQLMAV